MLDTFFVLLQNIRDFFSYYFFLKAYKLILPWTDIHHCHVSSSLTPTFELSKKEIKYTAYDLGGKLPVGKQVS